MSNTSWRILSYELGAAKLLDVFCALGREMLSNRRLGRWWSDLFKLPKLETLWAGTLKPVFVVILSIINYFYDFIKLPQFLIN